MPPIWLTLKDTAFYTAAGELESVDIVPADPERCRSIYNPLDMPEPATYAIGLHNDLRRRLV